MKKKFFFIFFFIFFCNIAYTKVNVKFLSIKNTTVNIRIGPSKTSPIKWVYKKKNFPVKVIDKYYNWRKIIDFENDSGWVHISQLSKKRSIIFIKNDTLVFRKATIYSKPIYKLGKKNVALLEKCNQLWCKIRNTNFKGWVKKTGLWGINKGEIIN